MIWLVVLSCFFAPANGATYTWNLDGNGSWNTAGNWSPTTVPNAAGDVAYLGTNITANRTITLNSSVTIGTLTFNEDNNKHYTLSPNSSEIITLDANGGTALISLDSANNAAADHIVNVPFSLSSPLSIENPSPGNLTFNSGSTFANNGNNISASVTGIGTVVMNGIISGSGEFTMGGTGTLTLGAVNTFTGAVTVNSGTLKLNVDNALPSSATPTVNGGTLNLSGNNLTVAGLTMTGGTVASGAGTLTLAGNVNYTGTTDAATISGKLSLNGGDRTFTVVDGSAADDLTISSVISSTGQLIKAGAGRLVLSGANSFTGNILLNAGTVSVGGNSGLGNNANNVIFGGGTLNISASFTLNGSRVFDFSSGTGTVDVDSGAVLTLGTADQLTGGNVLTKEGSGTLKLSAAQNGYTAGIVINNGVLQLNNNSYLADTLPLTINGSGTFDLNNHNETIGAVTMTAGTIDTGGSGTVGLRLGGDVTVNSSGTASVISGTGILTNGVGGTRTFTVNSGGTLQVATTMGGTANIVKAGGGTMQLTGSTANTMTGNVTVSAGTLELNKSVASGSIPSASTVITISGGTLLLSGNNQINDSAAMTLAGGTFDVNGKTETLGALTLTENSSIYLSSTPGTYSTINFAASDVATWTPGKVLKIYNWKDDGGVNVDQIVFGNSTSGLGSGGPLYSQILFVNPLNGETYPSLILSNGKIIPVPEPATWAFLILLGGGIVCRERRRIRALWIQLSNARS